MENKHISEYTQEETEDNDTTIDNSIVVEEEKEVKQRVKNKPIQKNATFINTDNSLIANLQTRVIALEYEMQLIRDKLFTVSHISGEVKLSTYGKQVKKRIMRSAL